MSKLPTEKFLALYWIPYVGIGDPLQKVYVPLTDVLNYRLSNGNPQASLVYLFAGTLNGDPSSFSAPYIDIKEDLLKEMVPQGGESKSNVAKLQEAGVKVVLSVLGSDGIGWSNISSGQQADFAAWVEKEILDKYGLDGIDIDDEGCDLPQDPQQFVDTVAYLRDALGDKLISKALWNDSNYFPVPVSSSAPNGGQYLADLLDFGATMSYGSDAHDQKRLIDDYHDMKNAQQERVGMAYDKLCIGVQAGPGGNDHWMTPLKETLELAQWAVAPVSADKKVPPIMGMMLFTFTQDIQQWDESPQNQEQYKWPNPGDHRWQQTIVLGMWGEYTVPSKLGWRDTGIAVSAGSEATVTYQTGTWTSNPNNDGGRLFDANGNPNVTATQPGYTMDGENEGALIGRIIPGGQPFLVGNGPTTTPPGAQGHLDLCINDDLEGRYGAGLTDNIGSVTVKITR